MHTSGASIYGHSCPHEFLMGQYQERQDRNPAFSVRAWARQLGLRHHAILAAILKKERKLRAPISTQIRNGLGLGEEESRYFDLLVLYTNAASTAERDFYANLLRGLRPDREFATLKLDTLQILSDWVPMAVFEMTRLPNFKADPQWIAARLGENVTVGQVQVALDRLLRTGLLLQASDGRLTRTSTNLLTSTDVPSDSIRGFHSRVLELAKSGLEQDVAHRNFESYTMAVDSSKVPEAKRLMTRFREELSALLESSPADEVYQFNMQLFSLTKGEKQ